VWGGRGIVNPFVAGVGGAPDQWPSPSRLEATLAGGNHDSSGEGEQGESDVEEGSSYDGVARSDATAGGDTEATSEGAADERGASGEEEEDGDTWGVDLTRFRPTRVRVGRSGRLMVDWRYFGATPPPVIAGV